MSISAPVTSCFLRIFLRIKYCVGTVKIHPRIRFSLTRYRDIFSDFFSLVLQDALWRRKSSFIIHINLNILISLLDTKSASGNSTVAAHDLECATLFETKGLLLKMVYTAFPWSKHFYSIKMNITSPLIFITRLVLEIMLHCCQKAFIYTNFSCDHGLSVNTNFDISQDLVIQLEMTTLLWSWTEWNQQDFLKPKTKMICPNLPNSITNRIHNGVLAKADYSTASLTTIKSILQFPEIQLMIFKGA